MTLDELLAELEIVRAEFGNLEVSVVSGEGQVQCVTVLPGCLEDSEEYWPSTLENDPNCEVNHVFLKAN